MNKLSFCTVCMNRSQHFYETITQNIIDNRFPGIEFVILDYNSQDGMEEWAKVNLRYHINMGLIKYYKTYTPLHFLMSHSKNMSMRLATGNILCSIDADNFAGPNYAGYINSRYKNINDNYILTTLRADAIQYGDQGGKLVYKKEHFMSVNGYDESMVGYGIEDIDLVNRLERNGGKRDFIEDPKFLQFISHNDEMRVRNFSLNQLIHSIYIRKNSQIPGGRHVMYLLKDNTLLSVCFNFEADLAHNQIQTFHGWTIRQGAEKSGRFKITKNYFELAFENGDVEEYIEKEGELSTANGASCKEWVKVKENEDLMVMSVKAYFECVNRRKLVENERPEVTVNPNGWGAGTVYLNFDNSKPIHLD